MTNISNGINFKTYICCMYFPNQHSFSIEIINENKNSIHRIPILRKSTWYYACGNFITRLLFFIEKTLNEGTNKSSSQTPSVDAYTIYLHIFWKAYLIQILSYGTRDLLFKREEKTPLIYPFICGQTLG